MTDAEVQRAHEQNIRAAERAHDEAQAFTLRMQETIVRDAQAAIRTAVLVNGGAAVALLAFVGGLVGQGKLDFAHLRGIASSLQIFAYGVAAALMCAMLSYVTNYCIGNESALRERAWDHPWTRETPVSKRWRKRAIWFHASAILAGGASLVAFLIGVFSIHEAILRLP